MHNSGIVRHCYVFLLTQQYKQIRYYGLEALFRTQQLKQLEFFHFILNPEQHRVFQLVFNKAKLSNELGFYVLLCWTFQ
jgi:hypothetical protein